MTTAAPVLDVNETDVPYLTVGGETMLARVYRPAGRPVAAVVGVHGGAWTSGDRLNNASLDRALAARGVLVAAIDFRLAPQARYPASVADVNFAIRWLKGEAERYGFDRDTVGGVGTSSGGHQLLLTALKPHDPAFARNPAPHDAAVRFAVAGWPIADPLARYHMALARQRDNLVRSHHAYFGDEATMAAGNPQQVLERGEQTHLPPLLLLQGTEDDNVEPRIAERFADSYRRAGGQAQLEIFPGQPHAFVTKAAEHPDSRRAIDLIAAFIRRAVQA
jgi:acetyl esterase/lipase